MTTSGPAGMGVVKQGNHMAPCLKTITTCNPDVEASL